MSKTPFKIDGKAFHPSRNITEIVFPAGRWVEFAHGGEEYWYGHGFAHVQPYPLERGKIINDNFAVNNIQCPMWMSSTGFIIFVPTTLPLSVRINEDGNRTLRLCCNVAPLKINVIRGKNLREAINSLLKKLGWPPPMPDRAFFGDVIFCTWTQYPRCITQERIIRTAREIRTREYPCSIITVDDRWESAYGELRFSKDFPDPRSMVEELKKMGFSTLLWVTPFVNVESSTFHELEKRGLLVRGSDGLNSALFRWWGGQAGLLDLTSPGSWAWFVDRLVSLKKEYGIAGFKIDGGDAKYQPSAGSIWHNYAGPSGFCDKLLSVFEQIAPGWCESRTAWLSQNRQIVWRQGGKDSHWGEDNGLKAMVHLALHMSLMGYDFFIPDMIPGRVQTLVSTMPIPTDELMVRWVEASAFMPVMQFSYFPWNYEEQTARICLQYANVHKALGSYLYRYTRNRTVPIIRPLWFDSPDEKELYSVDDEFLLGHDILVAPVLEPGRTIRNVILPPGKWYDCWTGKVCSGTMLNHPAPCPGIPVFVRTYNRRLFELLHSNLKEIRCGTIQSGVTSASYQAGIDRDLNITG